MQIKIIKHAIQWPDSYVSAVGIYSSLFIGVNITHRHITLIISATVAQSNSLLLLQTQRSASFPMITFDDDDPMHPTP